MFLYVNADKDIVILSETLEDFKTDWINEQVLQSLETKRSQKMKPR